MFKIYKYDYIKYALLKYANNFFLDIYRSIQRRNQSRQCESINVRDGRVSFLTMLRQINETIWGDSTRIQT